MNISIWQTLLVIVWIIADMVNKRLLVRTVPLIAMLRKSVKPSVK